MAILTDITLGKYYPGNSFIHRLDPRTKLITMMIIMTGVLATIELFCLLGYLLLFFVVLWISNLPFRTLIRNLRPFLWLFALTIAIHLFWTSDPQNYRLPGLGLTISWSAAVMGLIYSLRLALLILFAAVLTLTTSPIEMMDALEKLMTPLQRLRLPVHEIVMMLTLSLRFIPTLIEEAQRLENAQRSRGASFEGNPLRRLRNIVPLIIPLFVSAFRRADDLALAMDARCYSGGEGRTCYRQLKFRRSDILVFSFSIFALFPSIFG